MILIIKGQSNTFTLTLSEKCTLTVPYFLFIFQSYTTREKLAIVLTDISQYTARYNRFTLVEPTDLILIPGRWEYEVYEQDDDVNLDPALATGLVEKGVMKVVDETATVNSVYDSEDNTNTIYN